MQLFKNKRFVLIFLSYIIVSVSLFLFSYTQVDLSLTLSRADLFQTVEKFFQHIGFYQRPISTVWYVTNVIVFFVLYFLSVHFVQKKIFGSKEIWVLIGMVILLLVLSYPAFSYDMFNYMFTAKTVLVYHKNPYQVIPLQFTGVEPWLSFMHWTHLPSAYTPLWIIFTLPFYFLGFGYFLIILWNFKILAALCFVVTAVFIKKILSLVDPLRVNVGVVIFALNPLILFETLVSGHNDIFMLALAMISLYLFLIKKTALSYVFLALSVAAKLMTIFLYPVIATGYKRTFALGAMVVGFILVLFQREVLPWYLVWIIPYVSLLPELTEAYFVASAVAIGLLLRYAPYFYFGDYNKPEPMLENLVTIIPIVLVVFPIILLRVRKRFR